MSIHVNMKSTNTIAENAYYVLRKNIMDLHLKPGSEISIKDLSEALQVSRSPVRDAILRLSKEGLVNTYPQRGTFVSKIDLQRVQQEKFIRESLEEKVLLSCLERITDKHIASLQEMILLQEKAVEEKKDLEFFALDDSFHEAFFQIAEQTLSWNLIQSNSGHYYRIRVLSLAEEKVSLKILEEHHLLLQLLKNKDKNQITAALHEHCSKLKEEEEGLLKLFPEYFVDRTVKEEEKENFLRRDFLKAMDK